LLARGNRRIIAAMKSRWPWAVAVAATLRLYDLGGQEFWTDEATVLQAARWPWRTLAAYFHVDPHPPLFYLLVRALAACGLHGEFGLRLISAIAGIGTVAILAWFLARRFGDGPALVGGLLMAVNPLHVWASQELRGMALAGFFVALASALQDVRTPSLGRGAACRAPTTTAEGGCSTQMAATVALGAALYTHYYALLAVPVFLVAGRAGRRTALGAALLFSPWLVMFPSQAKAVAAFRTGESVGRNAFEAALYANAGHFPWAWPTWTGLLDGWPQHRYSAYGLAALLLLAPIFALAGSPKAARRLAAMWVAPTALALGASTFAPMFAPKYLAVFAPFLAAAAGVGFCELRGRRRWPARALLAAALIVPLWSLIDLYANPQFRKPAWRAAFAPLAATFTPADRLVFYCAQDGHDARLYWTGAAPVVDLFADSAAARDAAPYAVRRAMQPLTAPDAGRVALVDLNGALFRRVREPGIALLTAARGAPRTVEVQPSMGVRLLIFDLPRRPESATVQTEADRGFP
jgi:4-amino-4-deoxy-L-arabinose transferase-like glycosyltransferase